MVADIGWLFKNENEGESGGGTEDAQSLAKSARVSRITRII